MSAREDTAQQIDPLGALKLRPIPLGLAFFAGALALWRTLFLSDANVDHALTVLALVFLAGAIVIVAVGSSSMRAPLRRSHFIALVVLAIGAMVAEALASAGSDGLIRDDWGPTAVGLLLLSCAPYRPARDLVVATSVGSLAAAAVVGFEVPYFETPAPLLAYLAIGVTPLSALGVGAAAYSSSFVFQVRAWMARATTLNDEDASSLRPGIARSVQQDRVTGLNRDVVPFFSQLVESGEITADDSRRAGEVATVIRRRIVDDADRSWLEQAMLDGSPRGEAGTVLDRSQLAVHMTGDQRTAIRAIVSALAVDASTRTSSLSVVLHDDDPVVRALLRIESTSPDVAIRQRYAPYFAVLRILFADLHVDVNGSLLTLRFSYDQH